MPQGLWCRLADVTERVDPASPLNAHLILLVTSQKHTALLIPFDTLIGIIFPVAVAWQRLNARSTSVGHKSRGSITGSLNNKV